MDIITVKEHRNRFGGLMDGILTPQQLCAAAISVLGFSGVALADLVIIDHFDDPAAALNTSIWNDLSSPAGAINVADSIGSVDGLHGTAWADIETKAKYDLSTQTTYEFKFMGANNNMGIFGLNDTVSHYVQVRNYGGGWRLMLNGADWGATFGLAAGDILDMRRTATNWQLFDNGFLVSESAGLTGGTTAQMCMLVSPGSTALSLDYIGIREDFVPAPEPTMIGLLALGGMVLLRRKSAS